MVYEMPQDQVAWDIYNLLDTVKNKAMAESFVSAVGQWLGLSENSNPNTATESRIQKINSNMMVSLQNKILAYGSEDFAELYRDFVLYYRRSSRKKTVRRVLQWLSWTYKKLSKKQIAGDFNVVVVDPIQQAILFEDKKKALTEQYNTLVNNPNTPPFLLNNVNKMIAYYSWLDEAEIDAVTELDNEAYQCKQDVLMLNQNMNIYIPPTANPQMRLRYYNQAEDTEAKFRAIEAVKYMMQQWLGSDPMNMAVQPKVQQPVPLTQQDQQQELLAVNGLQDLPTQ